MKLIDSFIHLFIYPILGLTNTEPTTMTFVHQNWEETVSVFNNRFCRKCGICGKIEFQGDKEILVFWDKSIPEKFDLNEKEDKWINAQDYIYDINSEYEKLEYSFEEPFVFVNPYKRTPLSALIKFPTKEKTQITFRIVGKNDDPDIAHTIKGFNTNHEFVLNGLYPNYKNKVILTATDENGLKKETTVFIDIGNINIYHQWIVTHKKDDKFNYYASYEGWVHDENGNLRWLFNKEGWSLVYHFKDFVYIEYKNQIKQFNQIGKLLKVYSYPDGFYGYMHGIGFKPNGNLLVFGSYNGTMALIDGEKRQTHRDIILEFDAETAKVLKTYDLAEMINPDRSLIIKSSTVDFGKVDWSHANGIDYDAKNKAIFVSGRHMGVLKIDEKTEKPIWWFTPHQMVNKSGRNGNKGSVKHLMLTAVNKNKKPYGLSVQQGIQKAPDFKWPLKTHSVKYIGDDYFSIFDNSGVMYDKKLVTSENSVASIYKVDAAKKTVMQVFLKELPFYSEVGSSVIFNPKTKEILVTTSDVRSSNNKEIANTIISRYTLDGKELYRALVHNNSNTWVYLVQPFEFYAPNNWPTPVEKGIKNDD